MQARTAGPRSPAQRTQSMVKELDWRFEIAREAGWGLLRMVVGRVAARRRLVDVNFMFFFLFFLLFGFVRGGGSGSASAAG